MWKYRFKYSYVLLIAILVLSSCDKSVDEVIIISDEIPDNGTADYAFFGHTYRSNSAVDVRIEDLDLSIFDQIWLGGDICSETTQDQSTIYYLDNLFGISQENTHFSLGNHDIRNGNVQWITDVTQRPTYYTTSFNGITLMVLNTNFGYLGNYDTTQVNAQFEMIENVCDTIENSSHLIILSHHMVWGQIDDLNDISDYANGEHSNLLFQIGPNLNYFDGVFPKLQEVVANGVKVVHIAGDLGQKEQYYEFETPEGIQYLGSGITSEIPYNDQFPTAGEPDYFLLLHHDVDAKEIYWSFEVLD
ncbi:MAG: hypothetical protein ACI8XB_001795 [Patiriisocius sp.]|jgi:hypothetical protein